jgi:hypothetical protein
MKFSRVFSAWLASLIFLFSSCATRPSFNSDTGSGLIPGTTPITEVSQVLGAPDYTWKMKNSDGTSTTVQYQYPTVTSSGDHEFDILDLTFKGEILEGYCFQKVSGRRVWRGTDLSKALKDIKKGTSTKEDIIKAIGEPSGKKYCRSSTTDPLKKNNELWYWTQVLQGQRHYRTTTILMDATGVVTEIQDSESAPNTPINRLLGQSSGTNVYSR